jgi:hypothetical protein
MTGLGAHDVARMRSNYAVAPDNSSAGGQYKILIPLALLLNVTVSGFVLSDSGAPIENPDCTCYAFAFKLHLFISRETQKVFFCSRMSRNVAAADVTRWLPYSNLMYLAAIIY